MKNSNIRIESLLQGDKINFLNQVLKSNHLQTVPLAGDASSRRYFRIIDDDQSWVLMDWEPFGNLEHYPFLSVRDHFARSRVQVPEVRGLSPELGVVLLEDLGDLTLERKFWENQNQEISLPFYFLALDELIKIHHLASYDKQNFCTAFHISFDHAKLLWEMNYGKEHLLEGVCQIHFSESTSLELTQVFSHICEQLSQETQLISHRDYHSRNLMIKLGKIRVIDFQDARMGPVQYDLVSLLYDSYVQLNETTRKQLLQYYLSQSKECYGFKVDLDHFNHIFNLQIIQRCFKACGSFASFYNQRKDIRYLKYISSTLKIVYDHLNAFPRYHLLQKIIAENGLLNKDFTQL